MGKTLTNINVGTVADDGTGDPARTAFQTVNSNFDETESAFYNDVSGEISALTQKASPTTSDHLLIEDAAASNAKKRSTFGNLLSLFRATVNAYTSQQYFAEATLSDGANISWNLNTQQTAAVTLGGARTLDNPTNMQAGATYILRVEQDSTGSRTLAYGTAYLFPGGTDPVLTTTALATDILSFYCDGTNMYGNVTLDLK